MSQSRHLTCRLRRIQPRWTPRLIAFVTLLVVALVLMLQNWDHVDINVLFWDLSIRLVWGLFSSFILGGLLGWSLPYLRVGLRRR
ncbi:MAG TPA: LapA family protein [Chloroflexota bacterium]|nr:LapA family protein [Chloroflexota bacterium]